MSKKHKIPGLVETTEGGQTLLRSSTTGTVVTVSVDADGNREYLMSFPAFTGHEALTDKFDDILDLQEAYSVQWLRWAAVTIGMGFHPDTPSDDYEPPLDPALEDEYDALIYLVHGYADPYELGLEAWESSGIITPSPAA